MGNSIIFYFSGTGNSLVAAKSIASKLENCKIVCMANQGEYSLTESYEYIGFVYPCYFIGIPNKVRKFISNLQFNGNKNTYVFAVATCGGVVGNALSQVSEILNKKSINLNYGAKLKMFSNYVVLYGMSDRVKEKTEESQKSINLIVEDVVQRKNKKIGRSSYIINLYYHNIIKTIANKDRNFNVADKCNSCGICEKVCPVNNIEIKQGKPVFQHQCEQCVACIQFCPQKAINYKNSTQKRGRYTHPEIPVKDFIEAMKPKKAE